MTLDDGERLVPTCPTTCLQGLYVRARCGAVQPVLKGPCMIYCSGCCLCSFRSLRSCCLFPRLSFCLSGSIQGDFMTAIPVTAEKGYGTRMSARLRSRSSPFVRTVFDYAVLHVPRTTMSHFATPLPHQNMCLYVIYLVSHCFRQLFGGADAASLVATCGFRLSVRLSAN